MTFTKRVRCADKDFLDAVLSSKTYEEVSEKTGQKISTTISRYARTQRRFYEQGKELPKLSKNQQHEKKDDVTGVIQKLLDCME